MDIKKGLVTTENSLVFQSHSLSNHALECLVQSYWVLQVYCLKQL